MSTVSHKRSGTLVGSAVLAAVCGTIAAPAFADPPTDIDIHAEQFEEGVPIPWDFIDGLHTFGTTEQFDSGGLPGYGYTVDVTSGISGPDSYYIIFDWTAFGLNYGIDAGSDMLLFELNIDPAEERSGDPGSIDTIFINDALGGTALATVEGLTEEDGLITFEVSAVEVFDNNSVIVVEWTTKAVPAPGALALLGMAGFAGTRRRRRR